MKKLFRTTIQVKVHELDQEWVDLMKAARDIGLTTEDIKRYLRENAQGKAHLSQIAKSDKTG